MQLQHSTNLNIQRSQSTHRFNPAPSGATAFGVGDAENNSNPLDVDDLDVSSPNEATALCDEVLSAIDLNLAANEHIGKL